MRKKLSIFYIICACFIHAAVYALPACQDLPQSECENLVGCEYDLSGCHSCNANHYYDAASKTCKPCNDGYTSSAGSENGQSDCKKRCENKPDFANGIWPADDSVVSQLTACTWTNTSNITCNDENNVCDGYHREENTCVANKQSCGNGGAKFYINGTWSECYARACNNGQTVSPVHTCGDTVYGICVSNTKQCNTNPTIAVACNNGSLSGNATLNQDNITYNYSSCVCTKTGQIIDHGTVTTTIHFDADGNQTTSSNEVTSCDAGYYTSNGTECVEVGNGYYSAAGKKCKNECPYKSTTNTTTASSYKSCLFKSGTQITDAKGSYTLPTLVSISDALHDAWVADGNSECTD